MAGLAFRGDFDILDEIVFYLSFRNLGNALVDARCLRYVPPAVMTALIFPELFIQSEKLFVSFGNVRLLAGIAAIVTALLTKSILFTILAGILTMMLFNFLV